MKHNEAPLAWGPSGNWGLEAQQLCISLTDLDVSSGDWTVVTKDIADRLAKHNGEQRQRMTLSGVQPVSDTATQLLTVGWLGGQPGITEFDGTGRITPYLDVGFHAIGSGGVHAVVAQFALSKVTGISPLDKLKLTLQTAIQLAPGCDFPAHIWRIRLDGIEDVLSPGAASGHTP